MSKRESAVATLKKNIPIWVAEAQKKMLLQAWTISIVWTGKKEGVSMVVSCEEKYRQAQIEVNLEACKDFNDKKLRFNCYHEMAHILLAEYVALAERRYIAKKQLRATEEQVVEIITRIILGTDAL